jgi:hypothetical protein
MDSRSPSITAQKCLRRGFVTFEPSGHKKTVWSIVCAFKSSTTNTIHLAVNVSASFAILRGAGMLFVVKTLKKKVGRGVPN